MEILSFAYGKFDSKTGNGGFKAFFDRLRRCDATQNHFLSEKRCVLMACAGGTGRGTLECLQQLERGLTHMGMRVYDRISVVRYN